MNLNLITIVNRIIALLIAIIGHELGHGYVAYFLGDDTAKRDGRLSLNPLNHIDPIGLISMIIFRFGWAKAVPINVSRFKNRKRDTILVSLAGVCVNFIFSIIAAPIFVYSLINNLAIQELLGQILWYNVMLGVFNLVPLPPLDGSKVLASLLPSKLEYFFYRYERYFYIFLIIAVFSGAVNQVIGPIIMNILDGLLTFGQKVVL